MTPAVRFEADIGIRSGRIAAIGAPGELGGSAAEVFEAGGLHVLPGCIDGHVHLREPGLEHKEDIASGTTAAVAGGVTTVLDMPNTLPPTGSAEAVLDKRRRIESSAFCDVGVFGLIGTNNLDQLPRMAEAGVVGFKCFLGETSGGLAPPDDGTLLESLRTSARLGRRTAFHAENSAILQACAQAVRSAGRTDPLAHAEARPVIAEVEAIERVGLLASEAGAPVHIVHLSSRAGLASVRRWRDRGLDMTCETAAQYVFLSVRDMARVGSLLRVNPPLREPEDAEALLHALAHQEITCIASDHAPHTPAEKLTTDIWQASSGLIGVETTLRLFLTHAVQAGRVSLEQYVRLSAEGPARTWGLYPRKGSIHVGADADLVLIDLQRTGRIEGTRLHSKARLTPFEGWPTRGEPVATVLRGGFVMRDGEVIGQPRGTLVPRSL